MAIVPEIPPVDPPAPRFGLVRTIALYQLGKVVILILVA